MRILLVEDEARVAALVAKGLREHAYAVDVAGDGDDASFDVFSNSIEVYVQRLRRKVDDGHAVKLIHTRRGAGYVLQPDGP